MATREAALTEAAKAALSPGPVVTLPGLRDPVVWDELVEVAAEVTMRIAQLKQLGADDSRREALEDELFDALLHLAVHSGTLSEQVEQALVNAADPEELERLELE
jgi:hypothetical protein